jgi:Protein of unknown function (DUF1207)
MRHVVMALAALLLAVVPTVAHAAVRSDAWLEGYAAAVLERELSLTTTSLRVREGVLTLSADELGGLDRARVEAVLGAIPGITRVEIIAGPPPAVGGVPPGATPPVVTATVTAAPPATPPKVIAEWQTGLLPGGTLFKPLIADPRWPHFSASYQRYLRDPTLTDVVAVSFGETFALVRERYWRSWWELGLQAGVFSIFDLNAPSFDLINADYFVAVPFSVRHGDFSSLLRVFHQSSHLGDEFLLRTKAQRINLSYEGLDVKASYDVTDWLRLYAGAGYLFDTDPANLQRWSLQYGLELTSPWPDRAAGWRPIAAVDVQNREENDWSSDVSARAGVEIDGVLASRKMQILLEYFLGRSPNGQFFKQKIEYFGVGAHFHF